MLTGILDLGSIPYESVDEVPESGYSDVNDSTGVASRRATSMRSASRSSRGVLPINYAKLEADAGGDPVPKIRSPGS